MVADSSVSGSARFRDAIRVRGARVHNLRSVDVDLPRDQLTVLTGVSGSGKSSLAFDTIYAEGQRQYIETLSAYARQFLDQLQRPDVDLIDGLEPTLCIDQKPGTANPRSTVGTVTEVYDYLRLLYARIGTAHCPQCQAPIVQQSPEEIQQTIEAASEGTKLILLAPMVRGRRGGHQEVLQEIRKAGLVRARIDGRIYELDAAPELAVRQNHDIDAVVDRLVIRPGLDKRLGESLRLALRLGDGSLITLMQGADAADLSERLFSTKYACSRCEISMQELEPRTFSFNSPYGACPKCDGMGRTVAFDPDLIIPDWNLSPSEGALAPYRESTSAAKKKVQRELGELLDQCGAAWDQPLVTLKPAARKRLFEGTTRPALPGLLNRLEQEYQATTKPQRQQQLDAFRSELTCPDCNGGRLRPEALSVRVGGLAIHELTALAAAEVRPWIEQLDLAGTQAAIAKQILSEVRKRLEFLETVGVGYLTLDRAADSLSGGELQRVRLATSIGSGLVGVCYVLDEPSIGLHPRDNDRLIAAVRNLQRQGNTVLVVEHDEETIRSADWVIDMGPGAGTRGGQIIAQGTPKQIEANEASLTGAYLAGRVKIDVPTERRAAGKFGWMTLRGVKTHNLKEVDAKFPLSCLVGVAGVSGSGKSSLVVDTLYPALARHLGLVAPKPGPHAGLDIAGDVAQLVWIDQTPIGRSPRSCPATYAGALDEIRKVFAASRDAKQRGYSASRFSFNSAEGRCPQCQGQGTERIEMTFLSDLFIPCSACGGKRFNRQTLQVRYKNASIADVLDLSIDDATEFFSNFPKLDRVLRSLQAVA